MNEFFEMPEISDANERGFLLFDSFEGLSEALVQCGCRKLQVREVGWKFDTSLPQEVRDEMRAKKCRYALLPGDSDGMVYFYQSGYSTLARSLKYLRPFTAENVKIDMDGMRFSYFMTNDENALSDRLWKLGCLFPNEKDWKVNYALHKRVTDRMEELGAKYSITLSNGACVLNRYEGGLPYIINLAQFSKKCRKLVSAGLVHAAIKNDDAASIEKLVKRGSLKNVILTWSSLMVAAACDSPNVAKKLIELGADVNEETKDGVTALMIAAGKGSIKTVKILLAAGADKNLHAKIGWTALVYALVNNQEEIANLLSEKSEEKGSLVNKENLSFHDQFGFFIARFTSLGDHKPCEIYKNLNHFMSRQTFSKIQTSTTHPTKNNVILLSIGMRLSLEDTEKLLMSAGYVLSDRDEADRIIKRLLKAKIYDVFEIDCELYKCTGKGLKKDSHYE